MDNTLADTLTANLKSAKTPEEHTNALTLAMIALIDCQCKTAERVKVLVAAKDRADAIVWALRSLYAFAAGGGFLVAAKVAKTMGVL